jgi:hypothetical protein
MRLPKGADMDSPRKPLFWIFTVLAVLVFIAAALYLGLTLETGLAVIIVPVFIGIFLLFAAIYFTPAYLWFARLRFWKRLIATLILIAPVILLQVWLGIILNHREAGFLWFAPFTGIATGLNLRVALGKTPS